MNKREWLLAATALSAALVASDGQAQTQRQRQTQPGVVQAPPPAQVQPQPGQIGTTGALNPNARQTPPGGATRLMFVGSGLFQNERINTDGGGQAHILFADQSALTVGPNSDIVLDRFVYDPARDTGSLAIQAGRGVLRFVGGRVSKTGEVNINTPAGTIGIRGGVAIIAFINGHWSVFFFYGDFLNVAGFMMNRPGFMMNVGDPSSLHPLTQQEIAQILALLQGGTGLPAVQRLVFDPGQRPDWLTPDALQRWLAGLGGTSTGPDRGVDTWGPIIQLLTEGNNQQNRGLLVVPIPPPPPPQFVPPPPPPPPFCGSGNC